MVTTILLVWCTPLPVQRGGQQVAGRESGRRRRGPSSMRVSSILSSVSSILTRVSGILMRVSSILTRVSSILTRVSSILIHT